MPNVLFSNFMFGYSHYIHSFKKESTHFGLRILTNFGWRYQNILYPIIKQGKLINSQFFIHNVLPKNVLKPPTHILPYTTHIHLLKAFLQLPFRFYYLPTLAVKDTSIWRGLFDILTKVNPTILLDVIIQALTICLTVF